MSSAKLMAKELLRKELATRHQPIWRGFEARLMDHLDLPPDSTTVPTLMSEWEETWRFGDAYREGMILHAQLKIFVHQRKAWDELPAKQQKGPAGQALSLSLAQSALVLQAGEQSSLDRANADQSEPTKLGQNRTEQISDQRAEQRAEQKQGKQKKNRAE